MLTVITRPLRPDQAGQQGDGIVAGEPPPGFVDPRLGGFEVM